MQYFIKVKFFDKTDEGIIKTRTYIKLTEADSNENALRQAVNLASDLMDITDDSDVKFEIYLNEGEAVLIDEAKETA